MENLKDLTADLKVAGVTLLTREQAKKIPAKERRVLSIVKNPVCSDWWLRSEGTKLGTAYLVTLLGGLYAHKDVRCPAGIRPAILIESTSPYIVKPKEVFIYKELTWEMCPFSEDGYIVALCNDVLRNKDDSILAVPFREYHLSEDHKTEYYVSDYEYSTVKQVLERWAADNGIVNCFPRSNEETGVTAMTANEYQKLAMRTNDGKMTERLRRPDMAGKSYDLGGIIEGCLGLSGESGEFTDLVKKWIFHEKPLDEEHIKKELGDVLWYVALLCESFGWKMEDVMSLNIEKLKKRYPNGFDPIKANNRMAGDV